MDDGSALPRPDRAVLLPDVVLPAADAEPGVGHAVLVEDGRIAAVGPREVVVRSAPHATQLALPGRVLLPGLVDAHSHLRGLPTCRHGVTDAPLEVWIARLGAMTALDAAADALLAAVGLVTTGVTSAQVLFHTFDEPTGYLDGVAATLDALDRAGLHAEVILGLTDQAEVVPTDVEADLTDEQRRWLLRPRGAAAGDLPALVAGADALLAARRTTANEDAHDTNAADADAATHPCWVRIGVGPVGPQWASDALLAAVAEVAQAGSRRVHTHANETRAQRGWGPDTPLERLARHGLLTTATCLAHGIHLGHAELARCAAAGVSIASCPTSNDRLESGSADVVGWQAAGITVALGLDSTGQPDLPDAFAELRAMQRTAARLGRHLDARTVLDIATRGGAAALGRSEQIGAITPGRHADLVAVRVPTSWREQGEDLVDALVATTSRAEVTDVWTHGRRVVADARHHRHRAVADATRHLEVALAADAPARAQRRAAIAAVEPVVEQLRRARAAAAQPPATTNRKDRR